MTQYRPHNHRAEDQKETAKKKKKYIYNTKINLKKKIRKFMFKSYPHWHCPTVDRNMGQLYTVYIYMIIRGSHKHQLTS